MAVLVRKCMVLGLLGLIAIGLLVMPNHIVEAEGDQETTYILFVMDSSLSMRKVIEERRSRLDVAKQVMEELLANLPVDANTQIALRVYGAGLHPTEPCKDSFLLQDFGPVAQVRDSIQREVLALQPRKMTPIGYSLLEAAKDFPIKGARNVIVLITDGAESCRANPCQISRQLQAEGFILEPYIVGFDITPQEAALVQCIGKYYAANDTKSLKQALTSIVAEAISPTELVLQAFAGGANVTEQVQVDILNAAEEVVETRKQTEGATRLSFTLAAGVYTVRAGLMVGSERIILEQQNVQMVSGQQKSVQLDFGDLRGEVLLSALAGKRDISDQVTISVTSEDSPLSVQWEKSPLRTNLPAGTYRFHVALKDEPEVARDVTAWIPPNRDTHLTVDFGELPATLGVSVQFLGKDITGHSELVVSRSGQLEVAFDKGQEPFQLVTRPGTVDLSVTYQSGIPITQTVSNVVLEPGIKTDVVVDFSQMLGIVEIQVLAGEKDISREAAVVAHGQDKLELPLVGEYRQAVVPAGAYLFEATHKDASDSGVLELVVEAGRTNSGVIALEMSGMIKMIPYFGEKPAAISNFEGHVWQGEDYVVQLAPIGEELIRRVSPGTYRVVGMYAVDPAQYSEASDVVVTSGCTTEVPLYFTGMGTLEATVFAGEELHDPGWIHVYDEHGEQVNDLYQLETGVYTNRFQEGIYDLQVIPKVPGLAEKWYQGLEVISDHTTAVDVRFGEVGKLELTVSSEGNPYNPGWIHVYSDKADYPSKPAIMDLEPIADGKFGNELAAGTYQVILVPQTDGLAEAWLEDVVVKPGEVNSYHLNLNGIGELVLKVFSHGNPYNPAWIHLFNEKVDYPSEPSVADLGFVSDGVFSSKLAAGTYQIILIPQTDGLPDVWLEDVEVRPGQVSDYQYDFGGVGELELEVFAGKNPYNPAWIHLYYNQTDYPSEPSVADLEPVSDGVFRATVAAGTYQVVLVPDTDGLPESWLEDVVVNADTVNSYQYQFGGTGEIRIKIMAEGRPADPDWVHLFNQPEDYYDWEESVADLDLVGPGVVTTQVASGFYHALIIFPEDYPETWIPVEVKAGQVNEYSVRMEPLACLEIHLSRDGEYTDDGSVIVKQGDRTFDCDWIDEGQYQLQLAAGSYQIEVEYWSDASEEDRVQLEKVTVSSGQTTRITIELE